MEVKTFGDLVDWTRQLHENLARCLSHCADHNEEERARMLLTYLADHENEMEFVVREFKRRADPKALNTYIYDHLEHKPDPYASNL
ncbi:hypothetical protein [Onishia niordana]|jgi:dsDNA-binding SOS-regulon protein|uniref:hypothetical protein n=1 Tax=Onishia niordana TaxID=2508711 RepID=UPI001F10CC73|nr:hypothetical protein [Halomonas niordiana]|tara:strand:- start:8107 stop:8364 length:258 start_codon:yes stop_codon:yes gene_type:complete